MATVERSNIGALNDKLTVKLKTEDYLPSFEKKLKEYSKSATIPGFRKGHVPAGMIRKMHGQGVFSDEVLRTVEKELFSYLDKERPAIFAQPLPLESEMKMPDMNNPADIEFSFEIGLRPDYKLPDLSAAKLAKHTVEISDALVEEELQRLRLKGGSQKEKDGTADEDDTVKVLYTESNEKGEPVENGISKETESGVKYLSPKLKEKILGKKAGDLATFRLVDTFEGNDLDNMLSDLGLSKDDADAAGKYFTAEIKSVSVLEPRELSEEFYNEIYAGRDLKTEEAFRTVIREDMQKYWDAQSRNQLHDQLYHYLLDETKMEFPQPFLTRWLKTGGDKERTLEEAEAEYPKFQDQLKWTLISDNIISDNKLDVSQEELRAHMKAEISAYFGQMNLGDNIDWLDSYVERMLKDEKQVDAAYRRLVTEKLFNWAEEQAKPVEKVASPEDLMAMQHHHHH